MCFAQAEGDYDRSGGTLINAVRTAVVVWLMTAVDYFYHPAPIAAHEEL